MKPVYTKSFSQTSLDDQQQQRFLFILNQTNVRFYFVLTILFILHTNYSSPFLSFSCCPYSSPPRLPSTPQRGYRLPCGLKKSCPLKLRLDQDPRGSRLSKVFHYSIFLLRKGCKRKVCLFFLGVWLAYSRNMM